MPYVVTQSCCADAACVTACPVNCLHPAPGEPGFAEAEMLHVDPDVCVDCGACATACPADAVVPHTALTEAQLPFLELNASYYDAFPHRDRRPLATVRPQRRLRRADPVRVAVVGAGPAGLYTADELLKHPEVEVDVYDRLPTPHGLVRAGVAPDHPSTRQVTALFEAIERERGFRYLLGVDVGRDVTAPELRERYDAVVHAVGAASDRPLGVPGEDLPGSVAATALVGWYNGQPDHAGLDVPLDDRLLDGRVVVVGNGNVALDVARVLTASPATLARTDVALAAGAALSGDGVTGPVREVVVLGRRGPAQAAFTVPELIGLAGLTDVDVVVEADGMGPGATDAANPTDARTRLLAELAARPRRPGRPRIVLRFGAAPVRLLGEGRVTAVEVARTRLEPDADGVLRAVLTDERVVIPTGLVVRAVGYHGLPVPGLPHDPATGTVPHERGRVAPGQYVVGWAKRGPSGFIGTNKTDAAETVATLLDDLDAGACGPGSGRVALAAAAAERFVRSRRPDLVDGDGWRRIDAEERRRGAAEGRPRGKIVDLAELRAVAAGPPPRRAAGRVTGAAARRRAAATL